MCILEKQCKEENIFDFCPRPQHPHGEDPLEGRRLRGSSSSSAANPYDLLPNNPNFWTYLGSLTTPGW